MAQLIQARDISLEELQSQFNLHLVLAEDFFGELQTDFPAPTELERQWLERVRQNYLNLASRRSFSEEAVKMVVLSPLLDLAGFFQAPFGIQTEESVEITAEDEGDVVRGSIDVLVVKQQFWVLVIESKSKQFDVLTALPQALAYMLNAPNQELPVYGLLVNGREFVFVKLSIEKHPFMLGLLPYPLSEKLELIQGIKDAGSDSPKNRIEIEPWNQRQSLLKVDGLTKSYGNICACDRISFDLYPGQVLGIIGESGSGKSTLLKAIAGQLPVDEGEMMYCDRTGQPINLRTLPEARRRKLMKTEWGFVQQNPRDGLRMTVTAGANIGERLLDVGHRHYGNIRAEAIEWLSQVEIPDSRMDDLPGTFSGGMQQRLQLARILVTRPRIVLMDEPTGGLDVSVQARLLDLMRSLVRTLHLSVVLVTHDIGVVRLLAHRLMVMQNGQVVEAGLTDQVLDDPHHPYTQQLVSATLVP
jgi:putative phosphonate transport system ATP-binding protein